MGSIKPVYPSEFALAMLFAFLLFNVLMIADLEELGWNLFVMGNIIIIIGFGMIYFILSLGNNLSR